MRLCEQRVEDLLRAYGQSGGPLDKLAAALAPTETAPSRLRRARSGMSLRAGTSWWKQLGEGGMGAVFMAQQTQPVKRVVALKLIKLGMDSKQVLARFEAERQALALMDHPNIAKVLDAGTTDSGRPFFVMELVQGRADHPLLRRAAAFAAATAGAVHPGLPGDPARAPEGHHPPRHQADQRAGRPLRRPPGAEGDRLRRGQSTGLQLTDASLVTGFGANRRHSGVHVARAGPTQPTRHRHPHPTCTPSASCSTNCSPARRPSTANASAKAAVRSLANHSRGRTAAAEHRLSTSDALASIAATRSDGTVEARQAHARRARLDRDEVPWRRTARAATKRPTPCGRRLRYLADEPVEACPPSTLIASANSHAKHRKPVIALAAIVGRARSGYCRNDLGPVPCERVPNEQRATPRRELVDALGRARRDRDARRPNETGRRGILRTVYCGRLGSRIPPTDPAELRSFVDWSAIKESPLNYACSKSRWKILKLHYESRDGRST